MAPQATPDSVTYLLRDVDGDLWRAFKARADTDNVTLRDMLVDLVTAYAAGTLTVDRQTTIRRRRGRPSTR